MIDTRLLPDAITIRKPAQSFAPGSKQPVFAYVDVASGVPCRFDPKGITTVRDVLGKVPKRAFMVFLNATDVAENYEVLREADGELFLVIERKDFFGHHLEIIVETKR